MLDALLIARMQDEMTAALHETESQVAIETSADGLMALAMAQHRANFELWHEEDKARVPGVADAEIAAGKAGYRRSEPEAERPGGKDGRVAAGEAGSGCRGTVAFGDAGVDDRPAFDPGAEDLSHARGGAPGERDGGASAAERGTAGFA